MRKEAFIGLSVLLIAVSGSATVLDSFGVISGEASVEPAVEIGQINLDDSTVNLVKNTDLGITTNDDLDLINVTDPDSSVLKEDIEIDSSATSKELASIDFSNVEEVTLEMGDTRYKSKQVNGQ